MLEVAFIFADSGAVQTGLERSVPDVWEMRRQSDITMEGGCADL